MRCVVVSEGSREMWRECGVAGEQRCCWNIINHLSFLIIIGHYYQSYLFGYFDVYVEGAKTQGLENKDIA